MIKLNAKLRKEIGKKTKILKDNGRIPAIAYGPGEKNTLIDLDYEEFRKALQQVGESSLISLQVEGEKKEKLVLIHDIQKDPVSEKFIHIDFYQASLKQEIEIAIRLVFEGVSPAVKELGGTLVREIQELKVKALPQNLPHDIKIDISVLKTFEDEILVKDIKLPAEVKVMRNPEDTVALVVPVQKIEEDLEKPIEEKVDEVEKVVKEKKVKDEVGEVTEEKSASVKSASVKK